MTHTKGPWIVNPYRAQVDCGSPSLKGGLLPIAQMLWPTDERAEAETAANARLIAAAPLLLEALDDLLALYVRLVESGDAGFWGQEKEKEVIAARAALAAARQESAS